MAVVKVTLADMQKEILSLRDMYQSDPRTKKLTVLVSGESGTGKTSLLKTARGPVFIDMFDPGGEKSLRKEIEEGKVVVDNRWAFDDPFKPTAYANWKKEFDKRIANGFFDYFGTYCVDSLTTWSKICMNEVLNVRKVPGTRPDFTKDYMAQKIELHARLGQMMSLPCDFILMGHLEFVKPVEGSGDIGKYLLMTTGKGAVEIPLLFDERWITKTEKSSDGIKYKILTKSDGRYTACSRLASNGKIATLEEPDIQAILKKGGYTWTEKQAL